MVKLDGVDHHCNAQIYCATSVVAIVPLQVLPGPPNKTAADCSVQRCINMPTSSDCAAATQPAGAPRKRQILSMCIRSIPRPIAAENAMNRLGILQNVRIRVQFDLVCRWVASHPFSIRRPSPAAATAHTPRKVRRANGQLSPACCKRTDTRIVVRESCE
jgi:hypothetical protein